MTQKTTVSFKTLSSLSWGAQRRINVCLLNHNKSTVNFGTFVGLILFDTIQQTDGSVHITIEV